MVPFHMDDIIITDLIVNTLILIDNNFSNQNMESNMEFYNNQSNWKIE